MQERKIVRLLTTKGQFNYWRQLLKFSIVGLLNTFISTIFYFIFLSIGISYINANNIAYSIGMINSYILNKRWVFESKLPPYNTMIKFVLVNLTTLLSANSLLYLLVDILRFNSIIAQPIVTFMIIAINYAGNKMWTFRT